MILVVAVLGLLAVMGTVYIVAARTQRSASTAMNAAYNLDLAQNAAMQQVVGVIGNSMFDSVGSVGGVDTTGTSGLAARDFDYPEIGNTTGQSSYNVHMRDEPWLVAHLHPQVAAAGNPYGAPGTTDFTVLTSALFDPNTGQYDVGYSAANTFDVVGEQTTGDTGGEGDDAPTVFDSADAYVTLLPFSEGTGIRYRVGYRIIDTSRMANLNTGCVDDAAAVGDSTGTYITSVRLAPAANVMPANAAYFNPPTDTDTALNLHTNSAGIGRAGLSTLTSMPSAWEQVLLRIENPVLADPKLTLFSLSDELELRSYGEYGTTTPIRPALSSKPTSSNFDVWPYTLNSNPTTPFSSIPSGNPARRNYTTYSFDRIFRPYVDPNATSNPNRIPDYTLLLSSTPTSNTFALQSPGTAYTLDATNDTAIFPSNGSVSGNGNRLQPVNVNYPTTFDAIAPTDQTTNNAMFYVAMTASNLATLMESGCSPGAGIESAAVAIQTPTANPTQPTVFSHDETVQYVANFIAAKTNAMVPDPALHLSSPNAFDAYYLPAGPSFIDQTGICVRAATYTNVSNVITIFTHGRDFGASADATKPTINTSNLSSTLSGGGSNLICLGYAAQPFINEVAVYLDTQDDPNSPPGPTAQQESVIDDWAIELYNPYSFALSLNGYHLKSTAGGDLDLTGNYIPAGGYLVILDSTTPGGPNPPGDGHFVATAYLANAANLFDPTQSPNNGKFRLLTTTQELVPAVGSILSTPPTTFNLTLYRPYFSRGNNSLGNTPLTPDLAPIDHWDGITAATGQLLDPTGITKGTPQEFSIQRGNGNIWGASITGSSTRVAAQTLGQVNTPTGTGVPLYDRYAVNVATLNGASFANINEFNQVMRVCHIFSATSVATPTLIANGLLEDRLPTLSANTTPYDRMDLPIDSQLHFNFFAPPVFFSTTPTTDPYKTAADVPSGNPKPGDIRAVHLLDQISFIDRQSDGVSASSLGLTNTIDKLRLPGRINMNTASGDVVRAIPAIQLTTTPNQTVANILAYRDRLSNSNARAKYPQGTGTAATTDYSDHLTATSKYPGLGFRSMAELLNVLAVPGAQDLQSRDAIWAAAYNLCTVRSDTFVVYAYMEAVRRNPRYTGAFDNASVWYGTGAQNVADDPNTPTAPVTDITTVPLLRVAQRRWVAIIDRSFCNYDVGSGSFTLPKVVAIKDLPQ
jgi:hypothetical protein